MDFSLLDATIDVPYQAWFEQYFHVLLCFLCFKCTDTAPIVLSSNVGVHDLLVDLWHVYETQLFVHLVKHVTKKVTCILLLVIGVVIPQERLKDEFRVHCSLGEGTFWINLILFVEIFTDMNHFSQQAILIEFPFKILVLCNCLEQVKESWAGEQGLQADIHEAIDLLNVREAFVWLGKMSH